MNIGTLLARHQAVQAQLRQALNRVWRSRFARNVAVVASGAAGAQAITIAFAPVITRIYGPEAFGLLGTFMAIVAVATPLAAMAYPIAIVLPKDDCDAVGLIRLSIYVSFFMALSVAAVLWVGGDWLSAMLGAQSVAGFLFLIPVAMLFSAWLQVANQWLIRKREFAVIARITVAQSLIVNTAKAGIGWLNPAGAVLIVVAALGSALHAAMLFIGAKHRYRPVAQVGEPSKPLALKTLARQHWDFPLYRAPQNFINAASQSLPILMLAVFFGPASAGFYALGKMVMGMPSGLVGKAVADVFYPKITEAAHKGENLARQIVQATVVLFAIGIVPFGLVMAFGPTLFGFVFGAQWLVAGEYARWLALFFLFNFINKPAVATVPVLGLQRGLLVYEVFSTGSKVAALAMGFYWFNSDVVAIALFSIFGVFTYIAMMMWIVWNASRRRVNAKASG